MYNFSKVGVKLDSPLILRNIIYNNLPLQIQMMYFTTPLCKNKCKAQNKKVIQNRNFIEIGYTYNLSINKVFYFEILLIRSINYNLVPILIHIFIISNVSNI